MAGTRRAWRESSRAVLPGQAPLLPTRLLGDVRTSPPLPETPLQSHMFQQQQVPSALSSYALAMRGP
eukprot:2396554-Rhodomonas_salina.2